VIFSRVFLSILINIGLYFYTIKIRIWYWNTRFSSKRCKNYKTKKSLVFMHIAMSLEKNSYRIFIQQRKFQKMLACILALITSLLKSQELG
jgi:hypothetical protein